jgi:transmembrane sensor
MSAEREVQPTAYDWMVQLHQGPLSTAQKAALSDWLLDSPAHVRALLELMLVDHDLRSLPISAEQVSEWVQAVRSTPEPLVLGSPDRPATGAPPATARKSRIRWSLAAGVVVAVLGALGFSHWEAGRYSTGLGEQRVISLADGSVVSLNTESALKVDFSSSRRSITLQKGEAFFRVAHDPSRPFEVAAREATVKAVGTQFNVRMAARATVVSVLDGTVEIRGSAHDGGADPDPSIAMRVTKGEQSQIPVADDTRHADSLITRAADRATLRAAAWTQGRVDFDSTPLIEVIAEFQRYQIVSVKIDDRETRELKLTGSFDVHDPESALAFVATIPGIIVEKQGEHAYRILRAP